MRRSFSGFQNVVGKGFLKSSHKGSPGQLIFVSYRIESIQRQKTFNWTPSNELQGKNTKDGTKENTSKAEI